MKIQFYIGKLQNTTGPLESLNQPICGFGTNSFNLPAVFARNNLETSSLG